MTVFEPPFEFVYTSLVAVLGILFLADELTGHLGIVYVTYDLYQHDMRQKYFLFDLAPNQYDRGSPRWCSAMWVFAISFETGTVCVRREFCQYKPSLWQNIEVNERMLQPNTL